MLGQSDKEAASVGRRRLNGFVDSGSVDSVMEIGY